MTVLSERSAADVLLVARTAAEIRTLHLDACTVLDEAIPAGDFGSAMAAKQTLSRIWDRAIAALEVAVPAAGPPSIGQVTELLARVRDLESRVDDARVTRTVEMMRNIREAQRRLDTADTVDELLTLAAEETCTLGFDRAAVSTVEAGTWRMHMMVIPRDPRLAVEMMAAGQEAPPALDGSIIETDVVDTARPTLVFDVQDHPRVNRQLVSMSGCRSYGVAPLQVARKVIGFVHADSHYPGRKLDDTDLAVLNLYAEGVGKSLGRVAVLEGLASLQSGMARLVSATPDLPIARAARPVEPLAALSVRERQVIELMAQGRANLAIARELSISEGTVKTHITHILRKLDVANRAEAVATWLRR